MESTGTALALQARSREDGWTPDVQRCFIETLAETGSVRAAAKAAGRSASTAYRLRAAPHGLAFRRAWDTALAMAYAQLREVAFDRAVNGVEQPVFHGGEQVGSRIVHNDRLLMFLLEHAERRQPCEPFDLLRHAGGHSMPDAYASALDALDAPAPAPHTAPAPRLPRPTHRPARPAHRPQPPAFAPASPVTDDSARSVEADPLAWRDRIDQV